MGLCNSTSPEPMLISGPKIRRLVHVEQLRTIIEDKLKPLEMHLNDINYGVYEIEELQRFLNSDQIKCLQILKGSYDVGNFAFILIGEERKWLARNHSKLTSTFGYAVGEIYHESDAYSDLDISYAVNCYIDPRGEIWLIDPRDFALFKLTPSSRIDFVAF